MNPATQWRMMDAVDLVLVSRHDVKKTPFFNGMYYDGYLMLS